MKMVLKIVLSCVVFASFLASGLMTYSSGVAYAAAPAAISSFSIVPKPPKPPKKPRPTPKPVPSWNYEAPK